MKTCRRSVDSEAQQVQRDRRHHRHPQRHPQCVTGVRGQGEAVADVAECPGQSRQNGEQDRNDDADAERTVARAVDPDQNDSAHCDCDSDDLSRHESLPQEHDSEQHSERGRRL